MKRQELYRTRSPPEQETAMSGQRPRPPPPYLLIYRTKVLPHTEPAFPLEIGLADQCTASRRCPNQTNATSNFTNRSIFQRIALAYTELRKSLARRHRSATPRRVESRATRPNPWPELIIIFAVETIHLQRRPIRPRSSLAS